MSSTVPEITPLGADRVARSSSTDGSKIGNAQILQFGLPRRKAPPKRSRSVAVRLTGDALDLFERMESEMGMKLSTIVKDGLWLTALVTDELLSGREFDLVLRPRIDNSHPPVDLLETGPLCTVDFANEFKERHLAFSRTAGAIESGDALRSIRRTTESSQITVESSQTTVDLKQM